MGEDPGQRENERRYNLDAEASIKRLDVLNGWVIEAGLPPEYLIGCKYSSNKA